MKLNLICLVVIFGLSSLGCDQATKPSNNAPVINEIISNQQTITAWSEIYFTAIATDADGDSLNYYWDASGGTIYRTTITSNPTKWNAPNESGDYTINCTVSDGIEMDKMSIIVTVE